MARVPRLLTPLAAVCWFGAMAAAPAASAEATIVLREVRFWSVGEVTRIALETSEEVSFSARRLQDPERLFVDLQGTRPDKEFRGLAYSLPVGDGRVKQVRVALNQRGVTRVVVDLEGPSECTVSQLAAPERVMIEVRKGVAVLPGATPAEPERVEPAPPAPAIPTVGNPAAPVFSRKPKPFSPPPATPRVPPLARPFPIQETVPTLSRLADVPSSPHRGLLALTPATPRPPAAPAAAPEPVATASIPRTAGPSRPVPEEAPQPAAPNRSGGRSLTRALGLKLGRVVIDPGHGGHDHGTTGGGGLAEKDLVLDVSLRLAELLEKQLGMEVILTRRDDRFVPLEERTAIANRARADLFLSIHANSSPIRNINGVETYYLNLTASREDLEVAARENASSQRTVGELSALLQKIALRDKIDESREFAARVQQGAYQAIVSSGGVSVRNRGVKKAPFVVLIGASMPSVLTEIGFISNSREEALMKKPAYRQRVAEGLLKGISQYARSLGEVRVAQRIED